MSKNVFSSPFKHREDGHAPLSKEAHIKAHGGDAIAAGHEDTKEEEVYPLGAKKDRKPQIIADALGPCL